MSHSFIQPLLSPPELHRILKPKLLAGFTAEKEFHLSLNRYLGSITEMGCVVNNDV